MFKLDQCPACGCQELVYKSGTNKIGHWEGYKCQNSDCKVMTFDKKPKAGGGGNGSPMAKSQAAKDISEMKKMLEEIYRWVKEQKGEVAVTPGEMTPDDDIPF